MHARKHLDPFSRRRFLQVAAAGLGGWLLPGALRAAASAGAPTNDPTAHLKLAWTGNLKWANAVDVTKLPGQNITEQLAHAQALLAANGGGTVWFPPGTYRFTESNMNHFGIGGAGGTGDDGTPETHPHGFRQGIVIRDNYVFNTGRMGIGFCGDGVQCLNNVIRIQKDVWRPTVTGQQVTSGASTNDNRAVEMRGWRWVVTGNDYEVHRNISFNRAYHINDGEGLMHEDHVNATIHDSVLTHNRGNTYLSLYKTGGIDGLRIEDNDIRVAPGKPGGVGAIYVDANRNRGKHPCRNVAIVNNTTGNGGILIAGDPAENNVVKGNRYVGAGRGTIRNHARARVENNDGYEVVG